MKNVEVIAAVLLSVGGLDWNPWGAFELDLVALLFDGNAAALSKMVCSAVGIAALYQATGLRAIQQHWRVVPARA